MHIDFASPATAARPPELIAKAGRVIGPQSCCLPDAAMRELDVGALQGDTISARYHHSRPRYAASRSGKHQSVDQLIIFAVKRIYKGYAAQHETILEILGQQIVHACTLSRSP